MLYIELRKELPRRSRQTHTIKKTTEQRVVTISLLNPPRSYRSRKTVKNRIVTYYF